jgi:hypothetical protein
MATETQQQDQMMARPQKQHEWLQRLVGEWTFAAYARLLDPLIGRIERHGQRELRGARNRGGPLIEPAADAPLTLDERARLKELERRNRELEMEVSFLKKAAAYFAKDPR